jgi:hypothetical protein
MFGAMAAIVVAAAISSLLVLDIVTVPELRETLGRTLLVIGIVTTALLLLIGAAKFGMGSQKSRVERPASPPAGATND